MTEPDPPQQQSLVPGVVRLVATTWWRTTEWTVGTSVRAANRLVGVAVHPETAGALVRDVREAARELVGLSDLDDRPGYAASPAEGARKAAQSVPGGEAALRVVESVPGGEVVRRVAEVVTLPLTVRESNGGPDERRNGSLGTLRSRGEELLYKSRDVRYEEDAHPAYERLLDSLAPDEARILRLMLLDGPQPAVDVRTGGPLGLISSRLIAPGLSMIGRRAGLRYIDRVPAYLNNLNRLGLIWFSRETLRDPLRYQVLEAQPDVLEAIHSVRQAKIVRRSIHLTPFGDGFCRASLVPDPQLLANLPEHGSPEKPRMPQPPAAAPTALPEPEPPAALPKP